MYSKKLKKEVERDIGKIYKYLQLGNILKIDDIEYAIGYEGDNDGEGDICTLAYSNIEKTGEPVYIFSPFSVKDFYRLCQKITDPDYFLITSTVAMNRMNEKRARKRIDKG